AFGAIAATHPYGRLSAVADPWAFPRRLRSRAMTSPTLAVSLGYWQDRPPEEALLTAKAADRLGYGELWLGEMATYDAFALATAAGLATERIRLVIGPLAVSVRDPMQIARGVASVAALTGRPTAVALGTSSPLVVGDWHGRDPAGSQVMLRESA